MEVLQGIVGKDFVMCQLACDTPVSGSTYQTTHRDTEGLFFEDEADSSSYVETPTYQLAVNFPLCDVLSDDIGPLEIAKKTHLLTSHDQHRLIDAESVHLEALYMKKGDVLIRDVRCLHRGTPNVTPQPRAMIVMGFSRKWLRRPEVGLRIPRSLYNRLDAQSRHMLRFEPVVSDDEVTLSSYSGVESYDAVTLASASGNSIQS